MAYIRKTTDILTSHELDFVLEQIKDNSEVARLLLKKRHPIESLQENHVNYISISNSDKTKISYLTSERSQSIINSSPYGESSDELWSSSRRFHVKPGAFISKIFKDISSREIEIFSTLFRNIQSKIDYEFKIVSGEDILRYYHGDSYYSNNGSLGVSCMKYDGCQEYLKIYTENPSIVEMLIAVDGNGKLIGRALLWKQGDKKIMDRVYVVSDEDFQFSFKKWADENGYWYKKEQKWNNTLFFKTKDKILCEDISIQLDKWHFDHYPYLDTFKFLDKVTGKLYNYIPKGIDITTLSSADGGHYGGGIYEFCEKSKVLFSVDSICFVPNIGMRVGSDLCVYSDLFDLYILRDEASYDVSLRDWIYLDSELNNDVLIQQRLKEIQDNNIWNNMADYELSIQNSENTQFDIDLQPF
jgi:hypothetical protein